MKAPEEHWWSVRAGEYVLGTLRGNDLDLFEKILAHDSEMQAAVADWEKRLAGLGEKIPEQSPGEHILPNIITRIRRLEVDNSSADIGLIRTDTTLAPASQTPAQLSSVDQDSADANSQINHAKESSWRSWAGLATAASLILGTLLIQRITAPTILPLAVDGVAVVLSDDNGTPYFLVETDYGNLNVRVTALSPPSLDDARDFQLWQALPDRSAVRAIALLPEEAGVARTYKVDSLIEGSDLFGVSIEPVGAGTDNGPTGPVVAHGDYLPTQNGE